MNPAAEAASIYDAEGQHERRKRILELATDYMSDCFVADGSWRKEAGPSQPSHGEAEPNLRMRLFYALAFIGSGRPEAVALGNRIIAANAYKMCHFAPMVSIQLLRQYEGRLTQEAAQALRAYVASMLGPFQGEELDFIGVNDNFPCMSAYTTLIGGELLGDAASAQTGLKRLRQLAGLLTRRGFASEYASPTYTPIQLLALAELAEHTQSEEARALALQCEQRLWIDVLGHYHPPTFQTAGPYARAYTVDSAGHTHQSRFVLYALLGERLGIHPLHTLFAFPDRPAQGQIIHNGFRFMQISTAWVMNATYHCPPALVEQALNRQYPFTLQGSFEHSASTDALVGDAVPDPYAQEELYEYAAGTGTLTTYMTEAYALGTSTREFHNGVQTDSFHLLYGRQAEVHTQDDVGTVYAKYIVNDKRPGQRNEYPAFGTSSSDSSLWDEGRKIAFQHEHTAMVLYKPKTYACKDVTSLKLSLLLPAPALEEIWLGDRRAEGETAESLEPCPIYIKDGPVYMAFHPLLLTNYGRGAAIRLERFGRFTSISLINYEGEPRDFARRGLLLTGNGFVAEVRSEREAGDFAAFRAQMSAARTRIQDGLSSNVHMRHTYMRKTTYAREELTLSCAYSPVSEGVQHLAVNGRALPQPKLRATGWRLGALPLMEAADD